MALTKTIFIDGKEVVFRASAAIPRKYRVKFGRDIYRDLRKLGEEVSKNDNSASELEIESLETFENIAYIMAKHGDPKGTPEDIDDWLDEFDTFSIYEVLPEILELWKLNTETQVESRKNLEALNGN